MADAELTPNAKKLLASLGIKSAAHMEHDDRQTSDLGAIVLQNAVVDLDASHLALLAKHPGVKGLSFSDSTVLIWVSKSKF